MDFGRAVVRPWAWDKQVLSKEVGWASFPGPLAADGPCYQPSANCQSGCNREPHFEGIAKSQKSLAQFRVGNCRYEIWSDCLIITQISARKLRSWLNHQLEC